jgi:hypothetical protein
MTGEPKSTEPTSRQRDAGDNAAGHRSRRNPLSLDLHDSSSLAANAMTMLLVRWIAVAALLIAVALLARASEPAEPFHGRDGEGQSSIAASRTLRLEARFLEPTWRRSTQREALRASSRSTNRLGRL